MPSRATRTAAGAFAERSGTWGPPEDAGRPRSERDGAGAGPSPPPAGSPARTCKNENENENGARAGTWAWLLLAMLGSALLVTAVGCFCALLYPILKELRGERVRREDGTEERMLGFWSVLVLSASTGCTCCALSWTLARLDARSPDGGWIPPHCGDAPGHGLRLDRAVALLNGATAALAVAWSLS